ncbi:MAG: hypothetical protein IT305_24770 [Chloroflexi bacterium]|nr:hypothetical protein [Chloroflexota bacterium]
MRLRQLTVGALVVLTAALPGSVVAQTQPQAADRVVYAASLQPINANVTDKPVSGFALLTVAGNQLTIQVVASGLYPRAHHLQHIHGYLDSGAETGCPAAKADANGDATGDANGDGIIDIVELVPITGRTLIPLDQDPVGMMLLDPELFPSPSGPTGSYYYEKTVQIDQLEQAAGKALDVADFNLNLETRTIVVHGVNPAIRLPATVQSLPGTGVPASVTLPVACGQLTHVP